MVGNSLSEIVGESGVDELFKFLRTSPTSPDYSMASLLMAESGSRNPSELMKTLEDRGLLAMIGDTVFLSTTGRRVALLVDAINGGDVSELAQLLKRENIAGEYELVTQGMAHEFIANLRNRPDFGKVYICSPWINLDRKEISDLVLAFGRAKSRYGHRVVTHVITRPDEDSGGGPAGVKPFEALGAEISLRRNIHTKLYIREPGRRGGELLAIVGSENLTKSRYLELGIRIRNDSRLIDQLFKYFYDVFQMGDSY